MIDISKTRVSGFVAAIRGMRNPLESWERSDSKDEIWYDEKSGNEYDYHVGPNDLGLMRKLAAAGDDHGKFARFIHVSADIAAPQQTLARQCTVFIRKCSFRVILVTNILQRKDSMVFRPSLIF